MSYGGGVETMRRYLGLGHGQDQPDYSPVERVLPLAVTAGIFVAGIVAGLWPRNADRA